ncbi:glycosyltransferase family 9 protein [Sulfurimonas sp. SAG-AH-194-I05]|nr:glycosyltransferase family 9 protein [Sulfurimonas sp. SAG-AH-194-I05]MDF1874428.1 glycosyltransferase family 9 protein [Sulfurimonas sp. SAG-AH-194-I05]
MNILVVRNDKLGDFITALPTLYVLKKHNPKNKIIALVAPLNKSLALSCDFIDDVIVDSNLSMWKLALEIRTYKIDASITLFSNTKVALAQFLARIPKRIAPATKIAQIFYTNRVKQRRSQVKMAEFEYNLELTRELFSDINIEYEKPLLSFHNSKKVYDIFRINNDIKKDIIAFHVGFGGSSDANWTLDEYEILLRAVVKENKYQVVMTFGPDEVELYERMQMRLRDTNIIFYLSLEGLVYFAKLVSHFKLFVSTSTGTYHVASLVNTPTMTFFADSLFSSAKRWKGVGSIENQEHFMIPINKVEKEILLNKVKEKLLLY